MFQVDVSYPSESEEEDIVRQETSSYVPELGSVLSPERILQLQQLVLRVPAAEHVIKYAVALARRTRPGEAAAPEFVRQYVSWGAGPRASKYLVLAGKARALLDGRYAVSVDDVRALAQPTLQHRIILNYRAEAEGVRSADIVNRLLGPAQQ
jgi:MoxR-like ATPase